MDKNLFLSAMVVLLVTLSTATAQQAEAPRVVSWSNSKTGDQKTVFQVKPGEKITFTVKADGAEKYLWEVNGAARKTAGESLKWTVPGKKGLWKVRVKATNAFQNRYVTRLVKDFKKFGNKDIPAVIKDGYYPPQCRKEWIVSTFLKKVKPGGSVQKAIDVVPSEGGIVELLPGVHEIRETIHINKSNVAVLGTRESEVRGCVKTKSSTFAVNVKWKKGHPYLENITFKGFKIVSTDRGKPNVAFAEIRPIAVNNLTVEGLDSRSCIWLVSFNWAWKYTYHARSKGTRIFNNTIRGFPPFTGVCSSDSVVAYNHIIGKRKGARGYAMYLEAGNNYLSIHHNYLENVGAVQTESHHVHIFANTMVGNDMGVTARYNTSNILIENNIITGAGTAGIQFYAPGKGGFKNQTARNNIIYNCRGSGIQIAEIGWYKATGTNEVSITNNTIYNCGGNAIECAGAIDAKWILNVGNNIIVNNAGYGINLAHKNITEKHSYNNIWGNKKGKYNKGKPGTGDISADPLFADPSKSDFHLKSKAGRWDPKSKKWVKDTVSSPCIDTGDPKANFSQEPTPNGGRVNMGAYGNTKEASKGR